MAIPIKSPEDIAAMGRAGALAWRVACASVAAAKPGVTTGDLDALIARLISAAGAEGVMRGARRAGGTPFPACSSICVNEEVVHGVPGDRILRAGDVVTVDLGLRLEGWCSDTARGLTVDRSDSPLAAAAERCLNAGIAAMAPGRRWSEVARAVADEAGRVGVVLVGEYAGHGIGRELHEPPEAWLGTGPGGGSGQDFVLRPGMVLTLEPIILEGRAHGEGPPALIELDDGWTVLARDRRRACHEERTIAVARDGPVVLTA